jgi:hypothetical protein
MDQRSNRLSHIDTSGFAASGPRRTLAWRRTVGTLARRIADALSFMAAFGQPLTHRRLRRRGDDHQRFWLLPIQQSPAARDASFALTMTLNRRRAGRPLIRATLLAPLIGFIAACDGQMDIKTTGTASLSSQSLSDPAKADCLSGPFKTVVVKANFPDNSAVTRGSICPFGQDDNEAKSFFGGVRARIEKRAEMVLPSNIRQICESTVVADRDDWRYNQEFFLTLNGKVLTASDTALVNAMNPAPATSPPPFVWSLLKTKSFAWGEPSKFCLGATSSNSKCQFPPSETEGDMKVEFFTSVVRGLLLTTPAVGEKAVKNEMRLILVGDSDDDDCSSRALEVELTVKYIE